MMRFAPTRAGATRASEGDVLGPVRESNSLNDPTSSEYRELQQMKQRDREVRQHEQAHVAAGGAHVRGGASFSYATGPDGRRYATGGEVSIDTSAVHDDPAATVRKMQVVRSAALAPADPSPQDRTVAAEASRTEARARAELQQQQVDDGEGSHDAQPSGRNAQAIDAYRLTDRNDPGRPPSFDLTA
jgi:hypothetical protein